MAQKMMLSVELILLLKSPQQITSSLSSRLNKRSRGENTHHTPSALQKPQTHSRSLPCRHHSRHRLRQSPNSLRGIAKVEDIDILNEIINRYL